MAGQGRFGQVDPMGEGRLIECILNGGKTKEGGQSQKKKVEKPQDVRLKSGQNIGNPYQMEDNKAAPSAPPQGGGASRRPLGVLVVFHLLRISYVWA